MKDDTQNTETGMLQDKQTNTVKNISNQTKKRSRMEYFREEIEDLIEKGVSIRSAWKIINADLPEYAKVSYVTFYRYVKNNITM